MLLNSKEEKWMEDKGGDSQLPTVVAASREIHLPGLSVAVYENNE
jgi:hypothetical protein